MDINLLLEAERRGILPPDKQALLTEARNRGLVGGGEQPQQKVAPKTENPITQMVKNVPSSAEKFVVGTVEGVGTLAKNLASALTGDQEAVASLKSIPRNVWESLKDRYGSLQKAKDTAVNDPVGFAADVSTLFTGVGGAARQVGGNVAKAGRVMTKFGESMNPVGIVAKNVSSVIPTKLAGKLGTEVIGTTTGAGAGAIEEAVKAGESFKKAMRGQLTGEEIVENAKSALQQIRTARGNEYVAQLDKIKLNPQKLSNIKTQLDTDMNRLISTDQYNIQKITKANQDGTAALSFDFKNSPLVKNQNVIKKALTDISTWEDTTAKGLDVLKKRLGTYIDQTKYGTPSRNLLTQLRDSLSNGLKREIPEYAKMTKGYEEATTMIKDMESGLMLRKEGMTGRITADKTLNRLTASLRQGGELRKDLLRVLGDTTGTDIIQQVSGYSMNQFVPRGLIGKLAAGSGAYALYSLNPKFWPILAASSPRVVGEFLTAYVKAQPTMKKFINKNTVASAYQTEKALPKQEDFTNEDRAIQ